MSYRQVVLDSDEWHSMWAELASEVLDENKVSSFRRLETQKLRCDPARYDG